MFTFAFDVERKCNQGLVYMTGLQRQYTTWVGHNLRIEHCTMMADSQADAQWQIVQAYGFQAGACRMVETEADVRQAHLERMAEQEALVRSKAIW